jgi:hypothetical protein
MTATVDYDSPASVEVTRKATATDSPNIVNTSAGERIGCNIAKQVFVNTQTTMKPVYVVAGKLTATGTIDFRAAPDPRIQTATVDCNGKRLLLLEMFAAASSAAAITIAPGAANPYSPFGSSISVSLLPGERYLKDQRTNAGDAPAVRQAQVDATHKTIDVTISGAGSLTWSAVFGD